MPGIAGILVHGGPPGLGADFDAMMGAVHTEPFYASGRIADSALGLWAGWTAHRGSLAHRTCEHEDADGVRMLLAGECYAGSGSPCRLLDPAELVLAYRRVGSRFMTSVSGLFSGLVIDPLARRLLLFNDRYGVERLYVHETPGATFFASEAKALLAVLPALRRFDDTAVAHFLRYGSVPDGRTLFRGLHLLPGATACTFAAGAPPVRSRYFEPGEWEQQPPLAANAFEGALRDTLLSRTRGYLRADVPVGFSITGGLDTRLILACMPDDVARPPCYTFAATEGETLDVRLGRRAAALRGLGHHVLRVAPEFLTRFGEHVDRTVAVTDGCAGATGAHEIPLTRLARELSPIRLTGNYGSELLRSVSTLKPWQATAGFIAPEFAATFEAAARLSRVPGHPVTDTAFREIPWHLFGTLAAGRSQVTFRTPYLDDEVVRLAYRAPPECRTGPAVSARVLRAIAPDLAAIPTDRGVRAGDGVLRAGLRRAAAEITFKLDYLDKDDLPGRMRLASPLLRALRRTPALGLHKFLAYRPWFQRELYGHVQSVLSDARVRHLGFWTRDAPDSVLRDLRSGRACRVHEINAMLTLEAVDRLLLAPRTISHVQPCYA